MNTSNPVIRQTAQRQIILEELTKATTHPTASDLHDLVRKRLPRIGLATVYRNLEMMATNGMIQKLEMGGSQKRFDPITKPHCHIRCTSCGEVVNIDYEVSGDAVRGVSRISPYRITGCRTEFTGVCETCQQAHGVDTIQ